MKITQQVELSPARTRKMILDGFRESFGSEEAASNRAKFVAKRIGIQVKKLYEQIEELGLKKKIQRMRERAGVSASGRVAGAEYTCSRCGGTGHNSRSPSCPSREG